MKARTVNNMKPQIAWVITSGKIMLPFTTRSSHRGAISDFLDFCCGPSETLETLKQKGYGVLKVEMLPRPAKRKAGK